MGNCNAILGDDKQGNNEAPKARPSSVPSSNSSPAASLAPAAAPAQAEEVEVKIEEPVLEEPVEPIDPEDDPNYGLLDDDFAGNEGDHASRYGGGNSSVSKEVYIPVSFHGRLVGPKGSVRKEMEAQHGVSVRFAVPADNNPAVKITGSQSGIDSWMRDASKRIGITVSSNKLMSVGLEVNTSSYSAIVGHKAVVKKELESEYQCSLQIPGPGESGLIQVQVPEDNLKPLVKAIEAKLRRPVKVVTDTKTLEKAGARVQIVIPQINLAYSPNNVIEECIFFPDDDTSTPPPGCPGKVGAWRYERFNQYLRSAKKSVDVAVYNLTDDRTASALQDLKQKGVRIRIFTEADTMDDVGNDCRTLAAAGIEVRSDNRSPALMHHKFAIIDDLTVLSGSFNWSRSASTGSHENVVVMNSPNIVKQFRAQFERIFPTGVLVKPSK